MPPRQNHGRPAVGRGKGWAAYYVPANTRRDMPGDSRKRPMDAFLLSHRIQDVVMDAADDIAADAKKAALGHGLIETSQYANGFRVDRTEPLIIKGSPHPNPRAAAVVYNEDEAAGPQEFGNSRVKGRHILLQAGLKYHTPKGIS